jgi:CRISPR-associated protein Csx3
MSIKIVLCGPPKSGKSTLREGLKQALMRMPGTPYPYVITACPDGEGAWFQATWQRSPEEARRLKEEYKKSLGGFTPAQAEKFATWVRECQLPLTLVDIGGLPSQENKIICRYATHSIILYTNESNRKEWRAFCEELGLTVIAEIFSNYYGKADVVEGEGPDGVLRGSIHHLERGEDVSGRPMILALARKVISLLNP